MYNFWTFKRTEYLVFKIFLQGHFLTSQNFSIRAFWEAKWKSFLKSLLMSRAYSLKNELSFEITTFSAYVQNFETLLRIFGDLCLPKRLCFHKTKLFFLSQFMCRNNYFLNRISALVKEMGGNVFRNYEFWLFPRILA